MRRTLLFLFLANLALGGISVGYSAESDSLGGLDQARIRSEYVNGEFEKVQLEIARFQSRHSRYSRGDSICIARHLAVIHSANPLTVEVGEHWMHELFKLDTAATLSDMYVSEDIERLFAKARAEFMERRTPPAGPALQKPAAPGSPPPLARPADPAWKKPVFWMVGGAMAAAAATAIVLWAPEENDPGEPEEFFVPKGNGAP